MSIEKAAPAAAAPVPPSASARLVEGLLNPAAYPHPVARVELLETHISWVLLAGDFAYKVKKPVSLGFVDFATLEARRHFCEEELRLNRRTAPALYLDVVAITGTAASPVLGGAGPAIEYAVRMRRFPQEALLGRMAREGRLEAGHIDRLARAVAGFHARVERAGASLAFGSAEQVLADALANFTQVDALDDSESTRALRRELRERTRYSGASLAGDFARRKREGFVRECHGDLHLGNVTLVEGVPVVFDAIEFNESLRWIDVMADLAFPVMDLEHHSLPRFAWRLLNGYLEATGDYGGLGVLRFYLVYRAMVRAKVDCIRAHQADANALERERSARAYRAHLKLARHLGQPQPAALVVMHGLSGSGKTTVSQALLESLGAVRARSDVERKRLHGLDALARTASPTGAGLYGAQETDRTYSQLAHIAGEVLAQGYPAIVDAAFLERSRREFFREIAGDHGAAFAIVACGAPEAELRRRVERREREGSDASEAGLAILENQLGRLEPLAEDELESTVFIETESEGALPPGAVPSLAARLGLAAS